MTQNTIFKTAITSEHNVFTTQLNQSHGNSFPRPRTLWLVLLIAHFSNAYFLYHLRHQSWRFWRWETERAPDHEWGECDAQTPGEGSTPADQNPMKCFHSSWLCQDNHILTTGYLQSIKLPGYHSVTNISGVAFDLHHPVSKITNNYYHCWFQNAFAQWKFQSLTRKLISYDHRHLFLSNTRYTQHGTVTHKNGPNNSLPLFEWWATLVPQRSIKFLKANVFLQIQSLVSTIFHYQIVHTLSQLTARQIYTRL